MEKFHERVIVTPFEVIDAIWELRLLPPVRGDPRPAGQLVEATVKSDKATTRQRIQWP